jgi:hypothetical protein
MGHNQCTSSLTVLLLMPLAVTSMMTASIDAADATIEGPAKCSKEQPLSGRCCHHSVIKSS